MTSKKVGLQASLRMAKSGVDSSLALKNDDILKFFVIARFANRGNLVFFHSFMDCNAFLANTRNDKKLWTKKSPFYILE